jgi:hypothetical protein
MPIRVGNGMDDLFLIQVRWCRFEKRIEKKKASERMCMGRPSRDAFKGVSFLGGLLFGLHFLSWYCVAFRFRF